MGVAVDGTRGVVDGCDSTGVGVCMGGEFVGGANCAREERDDVERERLVEVY